MLRRFIFTSLVSAWYAGLFADSGTQWADKQQLTAMHDFRKDVHLSSKIEELVNKFTGDYVLEVKPLILVSHETTSKKVMADLEHEGEEVGSRRWKRHHRTATDIVESE